MLKNKEMFNPEKDRTNSAKFIQPVVVKKVLQTIAVDAPISGRQYKKRKQQEQSQNEITSLNTGSKACCSKIISS